MDQLDYTIVKREYEERVRRLSRMYGRPSDHSTLSRLSSEVSRRVYQFTSGRISNKQQPRVRSRISAPTAE